MNKSSNNSLPYGKQTITSEDINEVIKVLNSAYLTQGPKLAEFESAISKKLLVDHAIAVNSATSALHIACLLEPDGTNGALVTVKVFGRDELHAPAPLRPDPAASRLPFTVQALFPDGSRAEERVLRDMSAAHFLQQVASRRGLVSTGWVIQHEGKWKERKCVAAKAGARREAEGES